MNNGDRSIYESVKLKTLLEHLLSEDVDEAAVAVAQAKSENLALFVGDDEGCIAMVLYRPDILVEKVKSTVSKRKGNSPNWFSFDDVEALIDDDRGVIVGMIQFLYVPRYGPTYHVNLSAAEHGYGPLLYDLALSKIYPNFLMADRTSVSDSASSVWKYYMEKRPDVIKQLINKGTPPDRDLRALSTKVYVAKQNLKDVGLKDGDAAELQQYHHELQRKYDALAAEYKEGCEAHPLSYMYKITKPKSFVSLVNNHRKVIQQLKRAFVQEEMVDRILIRVGNHYATVKLRD